MTEEPQALPSLPQNAGMHESFTQETSLNKRDFQVLTKATTHCIKVISHHINVKSSTAISQEINCDCIFNGNLKPLCMFRKNTLEGQVKIRVLMLKDLHILCAQSERLASYKYCIFQTITFSPRPFKH